MSRLPQIGSDDGAWGAILNDFLAVSHDPNGTLKPGSISKTSVGLSDVDNTSDANKPISSATQTALNAKATDNSVVHLAGSETISGAKNFTGGLSAGGSAVVTANNLTSYYTSTQIDSLLRSTDAVVLYNTGSSSYPIRTTVTSDTSRPVRWRGPVAPTIGGAYAINNLDVWEMTP
jgi:hypothetical protein